MLLGLKTQQHLPGFPTRATGNGNNIKIKHLEQSFRLPGTVST
jgi:hypothetical protein